MIKGQGIVTKKNKTNKQTRAGNYIHTTRIGQRCPNIHQDTQKI